VVAGTVTESEESMRVAIIGSGTGHSQAPLNRRGNQFKYGWECWGCNLYHYQRPFADYEWDGWFELHPIEWQEGNHPEHMRVLRGLRDGEVDLYMQERHPDYPASIRFPREEIGELTPHGHYHCSTLDWMVSLAILEGADEIALHGVTMQSGEPESSKACLEYWLGIAEGTGIKVTTESWSDIFHGVAVHATNRQYGYDWQYRNQAWVPALDSFPDLAEMWGYTLPDELEEIDQGATATIQKRYGKLGDRLRDLVDEYTRGG
jgi:hypothetical protein